MLSLPWPRLRAVCGDVGAAWSPWAGLGHGRWCWVSWGRCGCWAVRCRVLGEQIAADSGTQELDFWVSSHPAWQLGAEFGPGDPSSPSASSTSCPARWPLTEMAVPCTLSVLLTFPRQGNLLKPRVPRLQELRASQEGTPCTGLLSPQVSPRAGCRAGTGLAPQHPPIARGEEMSPGGGVEKRGPCWKERVGASCPRRAAPCSPGPAPWGAKPPCSTFPSSPPCTFPGGAQQGTAAVLPLQVLGAAGP